MPLVTVEVRLEELLKFFGQRRILALFLIALVAIGFLAGYLLTTFYFDEWRFSRIERQLSDERTRAAAATQDVQRMSATIQQTIDLRVRQLQQALDQERMARSEESAQNAKDMAATKAELTTAKLKIADLEKQIPAKPNLLPLLARANPILVELYRYKDSNCQASPVTKTYNISATGCLIFHNRYLITAHSTRVEGVQMCNVTVTDTKTGLSTPTFFTRGLAADLVIGDVKTSLIFFGTFMNQDAMFGLQIDKCTFEEGPQN